MIKEKMKKKKNSKNQYKKNLKIQKIKRKIQKN